MILNNSLFIQLIPKYILYGFCSEYGNDIGTDKFLSKCGTSTNGSKPKQDKKKRDISKAIIHLKGLSNTRGNIPK